MKTRPDMARLVDTLVHAFFREVEVTGLEHVPADRGGVLVAWHPNGLVDPALIVSAFPRRVVFGARDGLFTIPILGKFIRKLGTVPIRRAMDAENADPAARRAANRAAIELLAKEVAVGSFACLFPEGASHDGSRPVQMKSGAARLYYLAQELTPPGSPPPVILPVGLFYDRKHRFRSRALVEFHTPLHLPPDLARPAEDEDAARTQAQALTVLIEKTLHEVVDATEDWEIHDLLQRCRKLLRADRGRSENSSLRAETEGFARIRSQYYALLKTRPKEVAALRRKVAEYDLDLRELGLEDADLDGNPPLLSRNQLLLVLSQALLVFFLLPPVLLLGFVVNGPIALLIRGIAYLAARLKKDQASIKLLTGALLFPAAWIAAGVAGYFLNEEVARHYRLPDTRLAAGISVAVLSMLGGFIALRYLEYARATARSVRVRLTRFQRLRTLARLRIARGSIARKLRDLATD